MKTTPVIYYIATVLFFLVEFHNCSLPDYIQVCQHDNPDLAGCIIKSIEVLRPRLKVGIPELEVPSLEKLEFDLISFSTSSSESTHLATNISNVRVEGASDFHILKLTPTITKKGQTFKFDIIVPQLRVDGDYEIDSKILLLQLKGKGPFHGNIGDFHAECILKGRKTQKEGQNHLHFEQMKCNLVVGKISINLENLFPGNELLAKGTNEAINDNSAAFFEELKPSLLNSLTQKFTEIANRITSSFTYEELFP